MRTFWMMAIPVLLTANSTGFAQGQRLGQPWSGRINTLWAVSQEEPAPVRPVAAPQIAPPVSGAPASEVPAVNVPPAGPVAVPAPAPHFPGPGGVYGPGSSAGCPAGCAPKCHKCKHCLHRVWEWLTWQPCARNPKCGHGPCWTPLYLYFLEDCRREGCISPGCAGAACGAKGCKGGKCGPY